MSVCENDAPLVKWQILCNAPSDFGKRTVVGTGDSVGAVYSIYFEAKFFFLLTATNNGLNVDDN